MTSDHTDHHNAPSAPGIHEPSRRGFLALASLAPLVATLPLLDAAEGFTFHVVTSRAWCGVFLGIGATADTAREAAEQATIDNARRYAAEEPDEVPDVEERIAEDLAELRRSALAVALHVRDEAEGWAVARTWSNVADAGVRELLASWRRAFPVDGPDPIAAELDRERAEGLAHAERSRLESEAYAARAREEEARRRAEREARPRTPEEERGHLLGEAFGRLYHAENDGRVTLAGLVAFAEDLAAGRPAVLQVAGA